MANMYMGSQALGTVAVVLNTADATATAADIMKDKTAYVGDEKLIGTHECPIVEDLDSELTTQDDLIAQISAAVVGKAGVVLPTLSNPAGAENIEAGYQAISGSGEVMEGLLKAVKPERVAISNSTSFNHTSRCAVNITSNPSSIGYEAQAGDVLIRADFQMVGYIYQYGDYLYAYFMHTVTATSTPSGEYYLLRGVI